MILQSFRARYLGELIVAQLYSQREVDRATPHWT